MKYWKRKRLLFLKKKIVKNGGKFDIQNRPSQPTVTKPEPASNFDATSATNLDDELLYEDTSSYSWLSNELEKLWRTNVTFLGTQRFSLQDPTGVYTLLSMYLTLGRQLHYNELRCAIFKPKFDASRTGAEGMQLDILATFQRHSDITLPLWKSSEDNATLVVLEFSKKDLSLSLDTLNSWIDALTVHGTLNPNCHALWAIGDMAPPQERVKLRLLFKALLQLEAKIVAVSTTNNSSELKNDVYGIDAVFVAPSAISRDVLDTILLRHPVLSQALRGLSKIYKRGRFAVVCSPKEPTEGDKSVILTPEAIMKFFKSVWVFADRGGEDVVDETELLNTIPNRNILDVIFRLVDINADGVISYEEALNEFKIQAGSEPGLAPLIDAEIKKHQEDQKLSKIRGMAQYHENIDPIMFVAADHAQRTVKANENNEKDPDVYNWHQLDLMCSWNLNNCTDYCASMPTLCFETCKSVLPRYFGDQPKACECLLPHMFVCNWPCFLRSWACTTKKLFEPCSKVSKCGGIHGSSCGWCKSSNKALPGDVNGPFTGECEKQDWIAKASQCPCEEMTHCDNIRGSTNCGWCNSTRTALPGTAEGPTDPAACPKNNWEFYNAARAPKSRIQYFNPQDLVCAGGDRCNAITSCSEIYASNGCGWCEDSSKAMLGSATGPQQGQCTSWIWNALDCPRKV